MMINYALLLWRLVRLNLLASGNPMKRSVSTSDIWLVVSSETETDTDASSATILLLFIACVCDSFGIVSYCIWWMMIVMSVLIIKPTNQPTINQSINTWYDMTLIYQSRWFQFDECLIIYKYILETAVIYLSKWGLVN